MGRRAPLRTCARAVRQWLVMLVLIYVRRKLVRLPVPVICWIDAHYDLSWVGERLSCDVDASIVRYWGSYTVGSDPLIAGWYLVEATQRDTSIRSYSFSAVWASPFGIIEARVGHGARPSYAYIRRRKLVFPVFRFDITEKRENS